MAKAMMAIGLGVVLLSAAGCATTVERARETASADLNCAKNNVTVRFDVRTQVGKTRYLAEGCDKKRSYVCQKPLYVYGLPFGNASCARERAVRVAPAEVFSTEF